MTYDANLRVSPDDMGTVILRSYKAVLGNNKPWLATTMGNYRPWPANVQQIDIPVLHSDMNFADIDAAKQLARNANWSTPTQDAVEYTRLYTGRRADAARVIMSEDYRELPQVSVLEGHGRSMRRQIELALNEDARILKFAGNSENDQTALQTAGLRSWPEGTTGAIEGDSTVAASNGQFVQLDGTLDENGAFSNNAAVDAIIAEFDAYYIKAQDDGFGDESINGPFQRILFTGYNGWVGIKNRLSGKDISPRYNEQLLEQARTVFGSQAVQVIDGITIVVTDDMPTVMLPTGAGQAAEEHYQFLFTTNRDTEYSPVETIQTSITPNTPPSIGADGAPTHGPMYAEWIREYWAMGAVDTRYNKCIRIKKKA